MKRTIGLLLMVSLAAFAFATGSQETAEDGPVLIEFKSYTGPIDEELDYSETAVGQYILDEFNLDIEIWPTSETTYREELVADFATGTVPDMLTIWVYPNDPNEILVVQKGAREGSLAPISDALQEHAPTIWETVQANDYPVYAQEYMADPTLNGETYFLPTWYTVGEKTPPGWAFVMRNDVLEQLNLDTPIYFDNPDDFIDVLRRVKALNPVDINGSPAWPMGGIRRWHGLMHTFTRLFDFGGGSGIDIDENTGKLNHFVMTDFAWEQILFIRQLLEEQLIDPETFTHAFEVGREKVAQGKYIVEPFFAGGGINYHNPTIEADPSMHYPVIGSFYTHLGGDGPLLVNNVGMQTHFLSAFGADAPLDDLMPFIEFLASPEGNATNYYGVEGVHWDWDDGNAVLRDEYVEDFLSTDIPSPYLSVGTGRFNFWNEVLGKTHPSRMIFGGTEKPRYPLDPSLDDAIAERTDLAYDYGRGIRTENGISIASFMTSYPNKDAVQELLSVSYFTENMMIPAYLADSEADARALLDDYRRSVERAGLDDFLEYLQDIYDENPQRYVVYESLGG